MEAAGLFSLLTTILLLGYAEGSASVDKGKGIVSAEMNGCYVSGGDRSDSLVNVIPSCLDMEVFSEEEPIPLNSYPMFANKKSAGQSL